MNRFLFAALVLVTGVPATAQELNPSPFETREETIEPIEKIEVQGAFKVLVFTTDDAPSVRFHGPSEMIADAEVTIVDGVLIIAYRDNRPWSWNPGSGTNVVIKLPRVSSVSTRGPASVSVTRPRSEEFSAAIVGAGRIEVTSLAANKVEAATAGSGSITLEGTSQLASYSTSGAGSIEGKRLRTEIANIAIGGAGSVYADVSGSANVAKEGAGRVEIVGGGACTVSPPDARGVDCR